MLNIKPFRQSIGLCGPASLKLVLSYYGIEKSEEEMAALCNTNPETGTEDEAILAAAISLGFYAEMKDHAEIEDIRKYVKTGKVPVIVDWFSVDDGHYSVVVDIDKENIYILDPSLGALRAFKLDLFKRIWFDFKGDFMNSKDDVVIRRMFVIHPKK